MNRTLFRSKTKTILLTGFVAGTLDILCAIFILAGGNARGTFLYIAKAAFGPDAYEGGFGMVILGALFHYIIAFFFSIGYFLVYPHLGILKKRPIINGLLYGIFIWCFMNYLVLPLTHNPPQPFTLKASYKNILILMFAVGLPVAIVAKGYYKGKGGKTKEGS